MNRVLKIGISNIGPIKKGMVLPILPGVSVLYGKNNLNGGNGNFVGKSLLANTINDVFYEPEIRHDKPQAGKRFIVFKKGLKEIKVVREFGRSDTVEILVDGVSKAARKTTETKKVAARAWGLTEDEFRTYGFVDAAVPHPLVKGGTPARKAFFNSFFGLDRMDAEKKIFLSKLSEIKKIKASHAELDRAFQAIRKDMLSKEDREALEAELLTIESRLKKLLKLQEQAASNQQLDAFKKLAGSKLAQLTKVTRTVKEIKADVRAANSLKTQLEDYKDYRRALDKYKTLTEGLDLSAPLEKLKKAALDYERAVDRIEEIGELRTPKFLKQELDIPERSLAELEAEQRRLKHSLTHSRKFAKGVCDTCGQDVKAKDPKKLAAELLGIEEAIEQWSAKAEYDAALVSHEKKKQQHNELNAELQGLTGNLPAMEELAVLYRKRVGLVKPQKVEKPEGDFDIEALRQELEITEFAEDNEELIEKLKTYTPVDFDAALLAKTQEKLYALKARLDLHNNVKARALEIRGRLKELRDAMSKQELLEIIIDAYSDKAMKKMAIESISRLLMATVNRYASLVFKNYTFEFVWGTQIQILVHRPEGVSDVRKLSGAESMLFTLILILSLLIFVPKSKRLSLLILDEPSASFSASTTELFTQLLPHITQVIPSVLIVTPKNDFRVLNANEFTALKTLEGTILKRGHPDGV